MFRHLICFLCVTFLSAQVLASVEYRISDNRKSYTKISHKDPRKSSHKGSHKSKGPSRGVSIELGPRPFYLVDDMDNSRLKTKLESCKNTPSRKTDFSISHRGAPLQFPEHTRESYVAAAKMGAGIIECDVTFTKDKELVCRHSQCDLHTTTNILTTPLASNCSEPFSPAEYDEEGNLVHSASARCCTSDITLQEFKSLSGKMDAADTTATTVDQYMKGTAAWRTELYSTKGTLMTHRESIGLFKSLGVKMTPELKSPEVPMPFDGFTQQNYARKMIDEYRAEHVSPRNVWAQSFNYNDVLYWIENTPRFGIQAVFLDGRYDDSLFDHRDGETWEPSMEAIVTAGGKVIAPPMWMLVDVHQGRIVPSEYALQAKAAGLDIIAWTFERSGPLVTGGGWYYQSLNGQNSLLDDVSVINNDGDMYAVLDVLAKDVGILGIFSDWPASVTYYANCFGL